MKKCYVLLGLLLAVAFLLPQGVFAAGEVDSTNVTITANTLAKIELTDDGNVTNWQLSINSGNDNENTDKTVNVKSNLVYDLTVEDSMFGGKPSKGYMVNWTGAGYVPGNNLTDPLQIHSNFAGEFVNVCGGAAILLNNAAATDDAGHDYPIVIRQKVHYNDPVLAGGNYYRIILKFTGTTV